jgi:hypothetical protein
VNQGRWCQEWYETGTGEARRRARQLRALGYTVHVSAMGTQVTDLGLVKMTLVDVRANDARPDTLDLPEVE